MLRNLRLDYKQRCLSKFILWMELNLTWPIKVYKILYTKFMLKNNDRAIEFVELTQHLQI